MRAELAEATAWAERGHEVALGQWKLTGPGTGPEVAGLAGSAGAESHKRR